MTPSHTYPSPKVSRFLDAEQANSRSVSSHVCRFTGAGPIIDDLDAQADAHFQTSHFAGHFTQASRSFAVGLNG